MFYAIITTVSHITNFRKMSTIPIIGQSGAGKTTFTRSSKNMITNPKERDVTMSEQKHRISFFKWRHIYDTPGNSSTLNRNRIKELFKKHPKIIYMFRANAFIEEVKHPESGGIINAEIKNLIVPIWNEIKEVDSSKILFFIANKENEDTEHSTDNIKEQILNAMEEANTKYKNMTGKLRYPHISIFRENAHFYCVNATNLNDVQTLTDKLFK